MTDLASWVLGRREAPETAPPLLPGAPDPRPLARAVRTVGDVDAFARREVAPPRLVDQNLHINQGRRVDPRYNVLRSEEERPPSLQGSRGDLSRGAEDRNPPAETGEARARDMTFSDRLRWPRVRDRRNNLDLRLPDEPESPRAREVRERRRLERREGRDIPATLGALLGLGRGGEQGEPPVLGAAQVEVPGAPVGEVPMTDVASLGGPPGSVPAVPGASAAPPGAPPAFLARDREGNVPADHYSEPWFLNPLHIAALKALGPKGKDDPSDPTGLGQSIADSISGRGGEEAPVPGQEPPPPTAGSGPAAAITAATVAKSLAGRPDAPDVGTPPPDAPPVPGVPGAAAPAPAPVEDAPVEDAPELEQSDILNTFQRAMGIIPGGTNAEERKRLNEWAKKAFGQLAGEKAPKLPDFRTPADPPSQRGPSRDWNNLARLWSADPSVRTGASVYDEMGIDLNADARAREDQRWKQYRDQVAGVSAYNKALADSYRAQTTGRAEALRAQAAALKALQGVGGTSPTEKARIASQLARSVALAAQERNRLRVATRGQNLDAAAEGRRQNIDLRKQDLDAAATARDQDITARRDTIKARTDQMKAIALHRGGDADRRLALYIAQLGDKKEQDKVMANLHRTTMNYISGGHDRDSDQWKKRMDRLMKNDELAAKLYEGYRARLQSSDDQRIRLYAAQLLSADKSRKNKADHMRQMLQTLGFVHRTKTRAATGVAERQAKREELTLGAEMDWNKQVSDSEHRNLDRDFQRAALEATNMRQLRDLTHKALDSNASRLDQRQRDRIKQAFDAEMANAGFTDKSFERANRSEISAAMRRSMERLGLVREVGAAMRTEMTEEGRDRRQTERLDAQERRDALNQNAASEMEEYRQKSATYRQQMRHLADAGLATEGDDARHVLEMNKALSREWIASTRNMSREKVAELARDGAWRRARLAAAVRRVEGDLDREQGLTLEEGRNLRSSLDRQGRLLLGREAADSREKVAELDRRFKEWDTMFKEGARGERQTERLGAQEVRNIRDNTTRLSVAEQNNAMRAELQDKRLTSRERTALEDRLARADEGEKNRILRLELFGEGQAGQDRRLGLRQEHEARQKNLDRLVTMNDQARRRELRRFMQERGFDFQRQENVLDRVARADQNEMRNVLRRELFEEGQARTDLRQQQNLDWQATSQQRAHDQQVILQEDRQEHDKIMEGLKADRANLSAGVKMSPADRASMNKDFKDLELAEKNNTLAKRTSQVSLPNYENMASSTILREMPEFMRHQIKTSVDEFTGAVGSGPLHRQGEAVGNEYRKMMDKIVGFFISNKERLRDSGFTESQINSAVSALRIEKGTVQSLLGNLEVNFGVDARTTAQDERRIINGIVMGLDYPEESLGKMAGYIKQDSDSLATRVDVLDRLISNKNGDVSKAGVRQAKFLQRDISDFYNSSARVLKASGSIARGRGKSAETVRTYLHQNQMLNKIRQGHSQWFRFLDDNPNPTPRQVVRWFQNARKRGLLGPDLTKGEPRDRSGEGNAAP